MEISELLERADILEYISKYVDLEQKGGEYWGISPFTYPPEKTPSFSVRPESGQFYDFSSGIGGTLLTFMKHYHRVTTYEAVKMLEKHLGVDNSEAGSPDRSQRLQATQVCRRFIARKTQKKADKAAILPDNYMDRYENCADKLQIWRKEGISDEAMRFFSVKYDAFSNYIVYPVRDLDGKIVNVGGRTLDPDFKQKKIRKYTYFHAWNGQMTVVYGLFENMRDILEKKEVILFEGVKSVMLARGFGYKNTGAILTSHLNPGQMKILARLGVRVVFALDKDVSVRADHNIKTLSRYVNVEYIFDFKGLLDQKDSPVDKGKDVFDMLYSSRYRYT